MRTSALLILLFCTTHMMAQPAEEAAIKQCIVSLFKGMQRGDTALVNTLFHPQARLQTMRANSNNEIASVETEPIDSFLQQIASIRKQQLKIEERMISCRIETGLPLASAWVEYEFYLNDKLRHKGVDAFHLVKEKGDWKIIQLADTRHRIKP